MVMRKDAPQLSQAEMDIKLSQAIKALEELQALELVFSHILNQFPDDVEEGIFATQIEVIYWLIEQLSADVDRCRDGALSCIEVVRRALAQEKTPV